jgi:hypothetical protein
MIRRLFSVLALLALISLSACSEQSVQPAAAQLSQISGQIVMPLEGTILSVYKKGTDLYGPAFASSVATGPDGRFSLSLPDGEYIAVARKRVTGDTTGPVLAGDNRSEFINLVVHGDQLEMTILAPIKIGDSRRLTEDAAATRTGLSGQILNSDGDPVEGARVHVYDHVQMSERPKYVSEKTTPDGRYQIWLPKGGTYYLAARDKFGGPPKLGDLYGRYDQGTIEPSAVVVEDGEVLSEVNITVTKVW